MQVGLRRVMVRGAYKFAATNSALRASLMAQMVENPTAMQETQVWSLSQKDPLKGMATHSCLENSMDRIPGYSPWGCKESDTTEGLTLSL